MTNTDDRPSAQRPFQLRPDRVRLAPAVRDLWSRFLIARLMSILLMAVVVTASAGGFVLLQKPTYKSQATVAVYPASGVSSGLQPFVMGTEKGVAASGAVLSLASQSLLIPVSKLQSGLSITVPADSDLLDISYTDTNPQVAQSAAEGIAAAYVAYRTTALGTTGTKSTSSPTGGVQAAIVTNAPLPTSPDSLNPLLILGAALIMGLSLGIGLALILDWLDDALRGPIDLEAQAGAPVLGQIPTLHRRDRGGLIVVTHPTSRAADEYGNLRTRVVQAAAALNSRALLVTSPGREDGTGVAANLAASLAQSGRKVVLLSADLRRGRAHALFGVENRLGVTSVVGGDAALTDVLAKTEVPGLRLIPNGPASPDPSGVLQSPGFRKLLTRLRKEVDFVVIDAPPVLTGADTGALAELPVMTLLVADGKVSARADVQAAAQELRRVRDGLIGCVLDNVGRPQRLSKPARPAVMTSHASPEASAVIGPAQSEDHVNHAEPADLHVELSSTEEVSANGNGHRISGYEMVEPPLLPTGVVEELPNESEPPHDPPEALNPDLLVVAEASVSNLLEVPTENGTPGSHSAKKRRRNNGRDEQ